MSKLFGRWIRLRRAFFRRSLEGRMAEEMREHIEQETARRIAAGEDPADARRRAAATFGSIDARTEEVRERRMGAWLEQGVQDLRYAGRLLRKSPGFSVVAVATLSIGIGATTAIFSAVDAVLVRPQPYPEPERLVRVFETVPNGRPNSVSGASFRDWRDHQTQFEAIAITAHDQFDLTGFGPPEKIDALSVSADFTHVFGLPLLRGRGFTAADEQVGGQNAVVLLTERFWRTRFGAAENVIGQTLTLDRIPHEIIGVMPDRTWHQHRVAMFVPYVLRPNSYLTSHDAHRAHVFGRLKRGATVASAEAELRAIKNNLRDTYPQFKDTWSVGVAPHQSFLAQQTRPFLLLLFGAVALVLLIACANVANLLLARAAVRQREIALRAALGASSRRIMRQVITESLLLALLGGVGGVLLAVTGIQTLGTLSADLLPATMTPQLDARVLGFSLLISCGTGLAFGLFPAWRARRTDLNHALKSGSTGSTDGGRARSQSTLVIIEVALTVVLLVATGLLVRAMVRSVTADPGVNPDNVLMFELTMPYGGAYPDQPARMAFLDRVREEIEAIPGVIAVATADDLPYGDDGQGYFYSLEEKPETRQDRSGRIKYVSQGYFETVGARIIRGRTITAQDNRADASQVMVINETMAKSLFADHENPLGRHINASGKPWEVIGVVADMRIDQLHVPPQPTFFVPHWEFPWYSAFVLRTPGEPLAFADEVAAAVHRLDPNLPLANLRTMKAAMAESLGPQKIMLNLIASFAGVALLLACIGLYGVMAYAVTNRQRELSVRVALGAARRDIMRLILGKGARLLMVGLVTGLLAAYTIARAVGSRLPGIEPHDPAIFIGTAVALGGVAFLACWLPARRAARADPIAALRSE